MLGLLSNAMKYSGDSRTIGPKGAEGGRSGRHPGRRQRRRHRSQKDQEHIFEDFYRVPTSRKPVPAGNGAGLRTVSHIAKAHGGTVRVERARPGEGSTFTIVLPLGSEP
ncbi:MAG: HAMP domain-containing histidine kinase [Marinilabiliales bacterium]|nr:HAMP domain-containing histidine kinase [Marinilabiliales bacterium]